jgi:hypothetical protein
MSVGAVRELDEVEQRGGPLPDDAAGQPEVPAVDEQVLPDGQLDVEGVVLRHHAEPGPDRRAVPDRVAPRMVSSPLVGGETQPIIRIVEDLPAPFGPRKAERLAAVQVEIDPVDRREAAESLGQAAGPDEYLGSDLPDT